MMVSATATQGIGYTQRGITAETARGAARIHGVAGNRKDQVAFSSAARARAEAVQEAGTDQVQNEKGWHLEPRVLLYPEEVEMALAKQFMEILFHERGRPQASHRELLDQWRYEDGTPDEVIATQSKLLSVAQVA